MDGYKAFSTTTIGKSHSKDGKECQDYSAHAEDAKLVVAVLADGHGSGDSFRSARGARFAVECALQGIADFVKYLGGSEDGLPSSPPGKTALCKEEIEKLLKEKLLAKGIVAAWHLSVADDIQKSPFTEEELAGCGEKYRGRYGRGEKTHHAYGTTLIAAAITCDYWFGFHIGDGRLTALYRDGSFDQPVPWDERCFLNVTTSVCDDDAGETARVWFCSKEEKELPLVVFLCSDGVDDSVGNEKLFSDLYRKIALAFADDGFDSTCRQMEEQAVLFATNSKFKCDDTSLAGFIDMAAVKETAVIYRKQMELEKAERERAERERVERERAERENAERENAEREKAEREAERERAAAAAMSNQMSQTEVRDSPVKIEKVSASERREKVETLEVPARRSQTAEEYLQNGNSHLNNNKYDFAIAAYDRSIEHDPDYVFAYLNRGLAYRLKGDYEQALASFDKTIELKPDCVPAYIHRGLTYRLKGNYGQALADFGKAIELEPDCVPAYVYRSWTYIKQGKYELAVADSDKAIGFDPDCARAYVNRGLAHSYMGKKEKAKTDLAKALTMDIRPDWAKKKAEEEFHKLRQIGGEPKI